MKNTITIFKRNNKKATLVKTKKEKSVEANVYAELVEKKAYELYEKRGGENGNDWDDWFKAERLVEEEMIKEA
ncbi:MAG TPA: DUF2934 domain-containing protein [Candidatus Omnitrophota bacterium]|nr:DUF2934 domain-containing protein [Candidatus Omnitrophota bacterium]